MIAGLLLLAAGAADTAPAETKSLQTRFDEASKLVEEGDCPKAIPAFEMLKGEAAFKPTGLGGAMLLVRQGQCLVKIGFYDFGRKQIEQGLPILRKQKDALAIDIANATIALGDVALARWDYSRATALYREAGTFEGAVDPVVLHSRLARSMAFDGGPEPLNHAEEAIRLAKTHPEISKEMLAGYLTIHARILLNQGQYKDAYAELRDALKLTGGLDNTVNQADIVLRSDLAIAAQLAGDQGAARQYLAYTGAGRFEKGRLQGGMSMDPPVCGAETGLRPEDIAIVEFDIGPDGHVTRAQTAYTRGNAEVAAQFARAVNDWEWNTQLLEGIEPFFLRAVHVELRCTTQAQEVPSMFSPINDRFTRWATGQLGLSALTSTATGDERNALVDQLRTMSERGGEAMTGASGVAVMGLLTTYEKGSYASRAEWLTKAAAIAKDTSLPPEAANWIAFHKAFIDGVIEDYLGPAMITKLTSLLERPAFAADPLASSTVRLVTARERVGSSGKLRERPELYQQVAADDRMPAHYPLRQLAYLSLANLAAKENDFAKASQYFDETGLTEEQCALIGAAPAMRKLGLKTNSYPVDAAFGMFEGWIRVEFDIGADGKTADIRPIVAYPPFIFNKAASEGIQRTAYEPSFRPSGGAACSASRLSVAYQLPKPGDQP